MEEEEEEIVPVFDGCEATDSADSGAVGRGAATRWGKVHSAPRSRSRTLRNAAESSVLLLFEDASEPSFAWISRSRVRTPLS